MPTSTRQAEIVSSASNDAGRPHQGRACGGSVRLGHRPAGQRRGLDRAGEPDADGTLVGQRTSSPARDVVLSPDRQAPLAASNALRQFAHFLGEQAARDTFGTAAGRRRQRGYSVPEIGPTLAAIVTLLVAAMWLFTHVFGVH